LVYVNVAFNRQVSVLKEKYSISHGKIL